MKKLKTLKDLGEDECGFGRHHIDRADLKAEAVKWYKKYLVGPIHWKEFFNITEEELKGEKWQ